MLLAADALSESPVIAADVLVPLLQRILPRPGGAETGMEAFLFFRQHGATLPLRGVARSEGATGDSLGCGPRGRMGEGQWVSNTNAPQMARNPAHWSRDRRSLSST